MRMAWCLGIVLLVVGCATTYTLEPAVLEMPAKPIFGPVSAYVDDGTEGNGNAWAYDVEMYDALRQSGLFSSLGTFGGSNELIVSLNVTRNSSALPALISAATVFVMPVPKDFDHQLLAVARVNGQVVKTYQYSIKEKSFKPPILDPMVKDAREAISILMSHLLADLARDKPFPPTAPSASGDQ